MANNSSNSTHFHRHARFLPSTGAMATHRGTSTTASGGAPRLSKWEEILLGMDQGTLAGAASSAVGGAGGGGSTEDVLEMVRASIREEERQQQQQQQFQQQLHHQQQQALQQQLQQQHHLQQQPHLIPQHQQQQPQQQQNRETLQFDYDDDDDDKGPLQQQPQQHENHETIDHDHDGDPDETTATIGSKKRRRQTFPKKRAPPIMARGSATSDRAKETFSRSSVGGESGGGDSHTKGLGDAGSRHGGVTTTAATTTFFSADDFVDELQGYDRNNPPKPHQLFVPSKTRSQGCNWYCIRLIAPASVATDRAERGTGPLESREAIGAWCLRCQTVLPAWRFGETTPLTRHMRKYHREIFDMSGQHKDDSAFPSMKGPFKPDKNKKAVNANHLANLHEDNEDEDDSFGDEYDDEGDDTAPRKGGRRPGKASKERQDGNASARAKKALLRQIERHTDCQLYDPDHPPLPDQLFVPNGVRTGSGNWVCIRLIAPAPNPNKTWESREALGAWCMLCQTMIPRWKVGETTPLSRHMRYFHAEALEGERGDENDEYYGVEVGHGDRTADRRDRPVTKKQRLEQQQQREQDYRSASSPRRKRGSNGSVFRGGSGGDAPPPRRSAAVASPVSPLAKRLAGASAKNREQKRREVLVTLWLIQQLRPFGMERDEGLQALCASWCGLDSKPSIKQEQQSHHPVHVMREGTSAEKLAEQIHVMCRDRISKVLEQEMDYYTISVDRWSIESGQHDVVHLQVHFLNENFEVRSFTLHVGVFWNGASVHRMVSMLQNVLFEQQDQWSLDRNKLAVVLHGSDPLVADACRDAGFVHQCSVGPCLDHIVGSFLLHKSRYRKASINSDEREIPNQENAEGDFDGEVNTDDIAHFVYDDIGEEVAHNELVRLVRSMVQQIMTIIQELQNPKYAAAKETWDKMMPEKMQSVTFSTTGNLDERPAWIQVVTQLEKVIAIKSYVMAFLEAMNGVSMPEHADQPDYPFKALSRKDWAIVQGLCLLLTPFQALSARLNTEQHPSLVYTLPFLIVIKRMLSNDNLLDADPTERGDCGSRKMETSINEFMAEYREVDFLEEALYILDSCRRILLEHFCARFDRLIEDLQWTGLVDPRLCKLPHCAADAIVKAKDSLVNEMLSLGGSKDETPDMKAEDSNENAMDMMDAEDDIFGFVFNAPAPATATALLGPVQGAESRDDSVTTDGGGHNDESGGGGASSEAMDRAKASASKELMNCLNHPQPVSKTEDPYAWWIANRHLYPRIAVAARKWMAAPVQLMAADRIFSRCGLVQSGCLWGRGIGRQLHIRCNLVELHISSDEVIRFFLSQHQRLPAQLQQGNGSGGGEAPSAGQRVPM